MYCIFYYKNFTMNKSKLLLLIITSLFYCAITAQAQNNKYHFSEPKENILRNLLGGEIDTLHNAVKWNPTPGDVHEFNALGDGSLYTFVDTSFEVKGEGTSTIHIIFYTAPMVTDEDGEFVNANSCHVCGVSLGYISLTKDNDSLYMNRYRRNFATHGTFGAKNYAISFVNIGDGYELIKIDDAYNGMGVESVATYFYMDGQPLLSFISKENNSGNREKNQKGYYEFKTSYSYDKVNHKMKISQTGFKIDEKTGKKLLTNKTKTLNVDGYTMRF